MESEERTLTYVPVVVIYPRPEQLERLQKWLKHHKVEYRIVAARPPGRGYIRVITVEE